MQQYEYANNNKNSSGDEIPERDVITLYDYLFTTEL